LSGRGIGASAGGLETLQALFDHVPADAALALVVIQHRTTDRTSVMRSLLERHTSLKVNDIVDDMAVKAGEIYIAPGDKDVAIFNGTLHLVEPLPHTGVHLPIDSFLRSLAQDEGERAICIILSGTRSWPSGRSPRWKESWRTSSRGSSR
jgi:two-component system CheB/CheR fusion protein